MTAWQDDHDVPELVYSSPYPPAPKMTAWWQDDDVPEVVAAAAVIAAAAVAIVVIVRLLNPFHDREDLKRRVAAAAASRNKNNSNAMMKKKKGRGKPPPSFPPPPPLKQQEHCSSNNAARNNNNDSNALMKKKKGGGKPPPSFPPPTPLKQQEHGSSNDGIRSPPKTAVSEPREASLGELLSWREEQLSREQFGGFNVYGAGGPGDMGDFCVECSSPVADDGALPFCGSGIHRVAELHGLPGSDRALGLLNRLCQEFEPVLKARGWTVLLLREFCCCSEEARPPSVAGYCVPAGNARTAVRICLRLRPPSSLGCRHGGHAKFYPYRDLVRTMAHELAHIVHIRHSDAFYGLMKDILRERDEKSVEVAGGAVFPLTSGRRLGTGQEGPLFSSPVLGSRDLRQRTARAALQRQRKT